MTAADTRDTCDGCGGRHRAATLHRVAYVDNRLAAISPAIGAYCEPCAGRLDRRARAGTVDIIDYWPPGGRA